jgi:hypothetical protein
MNHHSIGDGNKRITCPDQYLADQESDVTVVIWDPANIDIPIRVTVLTVEPKDPNEYESARWSVIEKAQAKGIQPQIVGQKAIYSYQEPAKEEGFFMHYSMVGMGNDHFIFSITSPDAKKTSQEFATVSAALEGMIESLVVRKRDEQFDCCLQESEKEAMRKAYSEKMSNLRGEEAWARLQSYYEAALVREPPKDSGKLGWIFGELLRDEVPSFKWRAKIDDYGRDRSLDFGDSKISIFPESMIWKRLDRKEALSLRELSSDTIEAVENLYRKYQEETSNHLDRTVAQAYRASGENSSSSAKDA